ncbi:MAG: RNA polymerase sigma factor [Anaerolineae bacterium]|nr:RNA polymerase sigma factor [Anaerolineae bacterium]
MIPDHPDGRLVIRLREGDVEALGELYEQYKTRLFRTARAITWDYGVAEDILHECFLRLFTHADQIHTDVPVGPWLYRVTVNLSYTWVQKHQRRFGPLEAIVDRITAPLHLLPENIVEQHQLQEAVQHAIEKLPLQSRIVVILFYLENMSAKEIADILDIPEGTVKSRLHYARQSLQQLLTGKQSVSGIAYEFT